MHSSGIFTRRYWREFRIAIQRAHKDPRARKSILLRFAFLAYLTGVLFYYGTYFYSFHDPVSALTMGAALIIILGVIATVRFSQWREAQRQLAADIASVPSNVTVHVQRFAHGLAAITQRALGELWLQRNTVPEGHSVITRRIQIDALRERGIWDEMPTEVRAWMMSPDGSWPTSRIAHVLATAETLNTLLWALALQTSLRPVEELLTALSIDRFALALQKPASGIRPTWDMRVERNRAFEYFWRCNAERVHRGELNIADEEQAIAVREWMAEVTAHPHEDYLAGSSTIRELDAEALSTATFSAAYRTITLRILMELLDGADVREELSAHVYASLLPYTKEHERDEPVAIQTESD